jgi:hypothetical protein
MEVVTMSLNLLSLWMPILLGALFAWIASAVIHMVIKHHNSDYQKLANEDDVRAAIGASSANLGLHHIPYCADMSEMANEDMQRKMTEGPVAFITIFPNGLPNMGKYLIQQIAYFVIGNFLIAYSATLALAPGAGSMEVFRVVTSIGFLAYGWASIPYSIWFGHQWSMTIKYLVDALIYAMVVGATFAWLWPAGG